jgi:hypothetical protein
LKLNAKLLIWTGSTITILSFASAAAQSLPSYITFYALGACGLSILIGGLLSVDWSKA